MPGCTGSTTRTLAGWARLSSLIWHYSSSNRRQLLSIWWFRVAARVGLGLFSDSIAIEAERAFRSVLMTLGERVGHLRCGSHMYVWTNKKDRNLTTLHALEIYIDLHICHIGTLARYTCVGCLIFSREFFFLRHDAWITIYILFDNVTISRSCTPPVATGKSMTRISTGLGQTLG